MESLSSTNGSGAPAVLEPSGRTGSRSRIDRFGPIDTAQLALTILFAASTLGVQVTGGASGLRAFDVLTVVAVARLAGGRKTILPTPSRLLLACLAAIAVVGAALPENGHLVLRSVGAGLILLACWGDLRFRRSAINGFILGACAHLVIGAIGYLTAGGVTESLARFQSLEDYRNGFSWLVGDPAGPPLIASGLLRLEGLTGHPNEAALIFVMAALAALDHVRPRTLRLVIVSAMVAGTILTLSRFGVAALIAGMVLRPAGRTGQTGRIALIFGSATAIVVTLADGVRSRLLDFDDSDNASERAAGPLDLLDDATLMPDGQAASLHNSLAYMLDLAGVLLGGLWIVAGGWFVFLLYQHIDHRKVRGLLGALLILFLTEDRIQSPSFLLAFVMVFALGFRARSRPSAHAADHVSSTPVTQVATAAPNVA